MPEKLTNKILFDGGENPAKWKAFGLPEGKVPDQYIERCEVGAVNLHSLRIGSYEGCSSCGRVETCRNSAFVAGEQAEL